MAAMLAVFTHAPLFSPVADPSQSVSTPPPTVAAPSPAAADGSQPSNPNPPANGQGVNGLGLDTPDSVWEALEGQPPALETPPAPALEAPPVIPPPAPVVAEPVVPVPTPEPLPRPDKLPGVKIHASDAKDFGFVTQVKSLQQAEGLSFAEASAKVLGITANLGSVQEQLRQQHPPPSSAPAVPAVEAPILPATLAEAQTKLEQMTRAGRNFQFEGTEEEHDRQAAELTAHVGRLAAQEVLAQQAQQQQTLSAEQQAEQTWLATYDQAAAEVALAYPGLDQDGSPINEAYIAEMTKAQLAGDPILGSADGAPIVLAQRAARAVPGYQPVSPAPSTIPPVSSPQPPASRLPVSLPGILPGTGHVPSTAHLAPNEPTMEQLMAAKDAWISERKSGPAANGDGLDDYR